MTSANAPVTGRTARFSGRTRPRVAVALAKGVQWIALVEAAGHGFEPPELPEPVTGAVEALLASTPSGGSHWAVASHRYAANFLVTGPDSDAIAEELSQRGACEKIVRCASRDDMLRVARVLALAGDYVVQGDQILVIFPPWF
jgi:hypothetical protein